ncbi:MAG TPA: hypothetical protein VM658_15665 [bacterium]|nr:hypothetical protein [bacterium]
MKSRILAVMVVLCFILPGAIYAEQWSTPELIPGLATNYRDVEPWISADGKTMYFSSDREGGLNLYKLEIYVTHLVDGQWTTPERLPEPLNDPTARDGHPSLTLDGRYMYFHSSRAGGFGGTDAATGLDIWMSENINGVWQQPVVLPLGVNTTTIEITPFISVDGQTLIFSSGDAGERDLYMSHKVNGVWQNAVNMGAPFHSDMNEDSPSLSYTGKYLFLGRGGRGDGVASAIHRATKLNGIWQNPVKLPAPVNTGNEEQASIYNDCTNTLYFYTGRFGASWDMATTQWLDFPDDNPCSQLIIPEGQWRVRVTLLEASAGLSSDIYIDEPISQLLIKKSLKNVGTVVSTPFISADELVFHIHVHGESLGLGDYDHYSNSEFARVERTDPLRYIVGFEDLPADLADWDYNDTVLLVELVGVEVNIWETENYLGEAQVVEQAESGADTELSVGLNFGLGLAADLVVPGAGLTDPSYGILVEGDPALYADLVEDAPFDSTGDFIKIELTSGQARMAPGNDMQIALELMPQAAALDAGDEAAPRLYRFDDESSSWVEVADQSMPVSDLVVANTPVVGLYALGTPIAEVPGDGGDTGGDNDGNGAVPVSSGGGGSLSCGQLTGRVGPGTACMAALVLLCPLFIAGMARIIKKSWN